MNIEAMIWDKVTITYDEPIKQLSRQVRGKVVAIPKEELQKVRITFKLGGTYTTTLRLQWGKRNDYLLTKAKLVELTPWTAKFEAYYWSSKDVGEGETNSEVRADVVCEF